MWNIFRAMMIKEFCVVWRLARKLWLSSVLSYLKQFCVLVALLVWFSLLCRGINILPFISPFPLTVFCSVSQATLIFPCQLSLSLSNFILTAPLLHCAAIPKRESGHQLQSEAEGEVPAPPAGQTHRPSLTSAQEHLPPEQEAEDHDGVLLQEICVHYLFLSFLFEKWSYLRPQQKWHATPISV